MSEARSWWQRLRQRFTPAPTDQPEGTDPSADRQSQAEQSLRALLDDPQIPQAVRSSLADDFGRLESLLGKLERDELHLAVFGRVSVGKSALANALLGEPAFAVSVLHGTTREATPRAWRTNRPLLLALNKADRYSESETERLLERLREHAQGLVQAENVVAVSALPPALRRLSQGTDGREREELLTQTPDIAALQARLLDVLGREGRTLSALNASLFAGRLSDAVGKRVVVARRELAAKVIRQYCITKSLAVALNPIPVADLLAAGALDAALVMHLARVYGLPLTQREAGGLIATICAQLVALMGAIWGVHLVASALKGLSAGMSTVLTATAQGALAWYATLIVGQAADRYLAAGKS